MPKAELRITLDEDGQWRLWYAGIPGSQFQPQASLAANLKRMIVEWYEERDRPHTKADPDAGTYAQKLEELLALVTGKSS